MARAVGRPAGISTCRAHFQRTRPHHWRSQSTQSGPRRLGVANGSHKLSTWFWFKLLDSLRLNLQRPGVRCLQFRSPARWSGPPWRLGMAPPAGLNPRTSTPNPAPLPPHARGRGGTTRGSCSRSSASQPPVVFRPYPPWAVGAGSGRVPGPKFAAGTAAGAAGGFLGHREGQKYVGVCPLGGAHQSTWSLYTVLGHTPRRRRSGGCATAISGSASKFAEDTRYEGVGNYGGSEGVQWITYMSAKG
jgi:hypothetical protein